MASLLTTHGLGAGVVPGVGSGILHPVQKNRFRLMSNLDSQVFSMQVVRIDIDFNAVHGIEDKYGIEIQDAGTLNVEVQLPQSDNDLVRVMTQTKEFIVETMDGNDKLTNRFILKGVVNLSLRFDFDYSTGEPVILYGTYMFKKLLQKELNRPNPFKKSGAI